MNNQFTIQRPFSRFVSVTQSKYKLIKKDDGSTGQGSYNLSLELLEFLKSNNVLVKLTNLGNEQNIYYTLSQDIRLKLGKGVIDIIGPAYNNYSNKILFVHTIANDGTQKFQIKRTDHKNNDELVWFTKLYDKNCEGAEFKIYYDANSKILFVDNDLHLDTSIDQLESSVEESEDLSVLELYKKYYLENLASLKENEELYSGIRLRNEFVEEYPLERIKDLTINEYALGTTNYKESLSHKLEFGKYKYVGLGIGGGTAGKHGIYCNEAGKCFDKRNKEIENPDEYFNKFKTELYNYLIEVGESNEFPNIHEKYPMIEGCQILVTKLSFLYYPEKFINIGKKEKLVAICNQFEIPIDTNNVCSCLSFGIAKFLRKNIIELSNDDPQWIGHSLWRFIDLLINPEKIDDKEISYNKEKFLEDVFISEEKYDSIVSVLMKKKNIILQGAPGVGKTFMAKRLAYSILGNKDADKVKLIQFHQSYSYEDFIEGYRPQEDGGFKLLPGKFVEFCEKAEAGLENDEKYFLIIDEINRGNLSKIFGELLMLVETDKRGDHLDLAYSNKPFNVPENLYIIGMMNTADRSLAIMDYALRRRFSFITIKPAFENDKFIDNFTNIFGTGFNYVIDLINEINEEIASDPSLKAGFQIGHSYFCPKTENGTGNLKDIQDIFEFEIIPLLQEYWEYDDPNKYKNILEKIKDKGIISEELFTELTV